MRRSEYNANRYLRPTNAAHVYAYHAAREAKRIAKRNERIASVLVPAFLILPVMLAFAIGGV